MARRSFVVLAAVSLLLQTVGLQVAAAGSTVGSFEIDGNLADDSGSGEPIDWATPPPNLTTFSDATGKGDDIFKIGSKELEPGGWSCLTGSAPGKDDIISGAVAFRRVDGDQFAYVNYRRLATNGDAHIDYEFNQSTTPNPRCPSVAARTPGDIVITFDTENGGSTIVVRAFEWTGNATSGTFRETPGLVKGVTYDGAVNIPNTIPGLRAGAFGEAALNLTKTIGEVGCREFSTAYMKTRSSTSINSELKDRTRSQPVNVGACPNSALAKAVRNVTTDTPFATSASASPGDTIEYRLTYTNSGDGAATNVVIEEEVPNHSTFLSCSDACTPLGTSPGSKVSWTLGTVAAGQTKAVTFQTRLDPTFSSGQTTITNIASVTTKEEGKKDSNPTDVNVNAPPGSALAKAVRNVTTNTPFATSTNASPGDTIEYRLSYSNSGSGPATNVTITEEVPEHSTFSSCSDACTRSGMASGSTITWSLGNIPAGGTRAVTFQTVLDDKFDSKTTTIRNIASVSTTEEGKKDSNPTEVVVSASPGSSLEKAVRNVTTDGSFANRADAVPGDTIEYRLTYSNAGSGPATNVVIEEEVPEHSNFASCSNSCTSSGTGPGSTIRWSVGNVPAGETRVVTFRTTLAETFSSGSTTITNIASVTTTEEGKKDSNPAEVVVTAAPESALAKAVRNVTAAGSFADSAQADPGETVEYRLTYTNSGSGPASNVTISEEVPDRSTFLSCSDACITSGTASGSTLTWNLGSVPSGATRAVTFQTKLDESFPSGNTTITNIATVTTAEEGPTDSNPTRVIVAAAPELGLVKSANGTQFEPGQQVTYTLSYTNTGNAPARNTTIKETIPDNTRFASCSPETDCTTSGDPVTGVSWDLGTVSPGDEGSVTLTVTVLNTVGCEICNVATIASLDQNSGAPVSSNRLCVKGVPGGRPDLANANDSAFGAHVKDPQLGIDRTLVPVRSEQHGVGSDSQSAQVLNPRVPDPNGENLRADVIRTSSKSTITELPPEARHVSEAEAVNVDILNGTVTASLVRGVAETVATGTRSSFSSAGSGFKDLRIRGTAYNNVAPNTRVDLPELLYGPGSYVILYERVGSTSVPPLTQNSGGTYAADLTVNMIKVHITDKAPVLPGSQPLDVVVSHAKAHSDFPQTTLCEERADQSVSGHAFVASAQLNPDVLGILVGYTDIPTTGGSDHQNLENAAVPANGSGATAGASVSHSEGTINDPLDPLASRASSYAQAANVCVLPSNGACTIAADVVRSQSNARATSGGASANDDGSFFTNVRVLGTSRTIEAPNQRIDLPGIGYVVFNEQVCDNEDDGASLANGCDTGDGHAGLTVRAIHVFVTVPGALGLPAGAEVVVAEAHSDATYR